jgi:hypothetical protein
MSASVLDKVNIKYAHLLDIEKIEWYTKLRFAATPRRILHIVWGFKGEQALTKRFCPPIIIFSSILPKRNHPLTPIFSSLFTVVLKRNRT